MSQPSFRKNSFDQKSVTFLRMLVKLVLYSVFLRTASFARSHKCVLCARPLHQKNSTPTSRALKARAKKIRQFKINDTFIVAQTPQKACLLLNILFVTLAKVDPSSRLKRYALLRCAWPAPHPFKNVTRNITYGRPLNVSHSKLKSLLDLFGQSVAVIIPR